MLYVRFSIASLKSFISKQVLFFVSPPFCYYYTFQSFLLVVQLAFGPTILGMIHGIHSVIICNVIEVFFQFKNKKDEKTSMTLQINILRMKNMNLSKVVGLRGHSEGVSM